MEIGVFGTCRIDDYNILDFKKITSIYPFIYTNKHTIINVRPLGYTTTTSDILQNLSLIKNGKYKEIIKDKFIFKNIFLKHGGQTIISTIDYQYLVLEICSIKKIIHKKTNYIFPYEIEGCKYNEVDFLTATEDCNETVSNILKIRDLINCKVILLPPIIEFDGKCIKGLHENTLPDKVIEYRTEILNRLKIASKEKDIVLFDWNEIINVKGKDKMLLDQFHFTDFGKKYISEQIYNIVTHFDNYTFDH